MRRLLVLACLLAACGGTVAGADSGTEAGTDSGGCPQPPPVPVYDCEAGPPDAEGCGPWDTTQPTPVYPVGCTVTTTQMGTYCGPVTCNCTKDFPDSGPSWVCPL